MTSFVRKQLIVFAALSVAAFATIALVYVHVPTLLGAGQLTVRAEIPAAGGIYPNANVTYRGYTIGKVKEVELVPGGVEAVMSIDDDLVPPANSRAEVHSVSAIGEQFIDFVPPANPSTRLLADGAVIPKSQTGIPAPTADVLNSVDSLLSTVDKTDLATVLDEFNTAFQGIGPDLQAIVDNTKSLLDSAEGSYPQTQQLITDAEPFLDSQIASGDDAKQWAQRLASVTAQLKQSDGDLRGALRNGDAAGQQVSGLLDSLRGTTPRMLDNTNVLTELAQAYHKPIEQILVIYPALQAFYQSALGPDTRQMINFNIKLNPNRPACYDGWVGPGEPGGPRDAFELADEPYPADQYCKLPQNDDRLVRGSRNLPCFEPGSPPGRRAATVQQCRGGTGFQPTSGAPGTQLQVGGPLNDAPLLNSQGLLLPLDVVPADPPGEKQVVPGDLSALLLGNGGK